MHKQTHKRAFYTLAGCIAALALCVAASLFLLTPAPKAQDGKNRSIFREFCRKNVSQFSELCYIYKHKKDFTEWSA